MDGAMYFRRVSNLSNDAISFGWRETRLPGQRQRQLDAVVRSLRSTGRFNSYSRNTGPRKPGPALEQWDHNHLQLPSRRAYVSAEFSRRVPQSVSVRRGGTTCSRVGHKHSDV